MDHSGVQSVISEACEGKSMGWHACVSDRLHNTAEHSAEVKSASCASGRIRDAGIKRREMFARKEKITTYVLTNEVKQRGQGVVQSIRTSVPPATRAAQYNYSISGYHK
ncbi:hypothetical protein ACLKA6_009738 [Drosophila palustris]